MTGLFGFTPIDAYATNVHVHVHVLGYMCLLYLVVVIGEVFHVVVYLQKLVYETFQTMWFTPLAENHESRIARLRNRVMNITNVVTACKEADCEWFEHLIGNVRTLSQCAMSVKTPVGVGNLGQLPPWNFRLKLFYGRSDYVTSAIL